MSRKRNITDIDNIIYILEDIDEFNYADNIDEIVTTLRKIDKDVDNLTEKVEEYEEKYENWCTISISDAKIHGVRPTESYTRLIATTLSEEMELEVP